MAMNHQMVQRTSNVQQSSHKGLRVIRLPLLASSSGKAINLGCLIEERQVTSHCKNSAKVTTVTYRTEPYL